MMYPRAEPSAKNTSSVEDTDLLEAMVVECLAVAKLIVAIGHIREIFEQESLFQNFRHVAPAWVKKSLCWLKEPQTISAVASFSLSFTTALTGISG
jgi:hypothetical protein